MKRNLLCLFFIVSNYFGYGQKTARQISFRIIERDSVMLTLDEKYYLIEDSCAQIIRYSHLNFPERKFFGKFKDVSKANPNLIVAEGTYNEAGLKNGLFTTRYLNGNLQSRGSFKDDKYDGKWEMFYNDGKPELSFEVINGAYTITDAWDTDGNKIVDNGNGFYIDSTGIWYWVGKLLDGKPDGKWKLTRGGDPRTSLETEQFKKGKFMGGEKGEVSYNDASHIVLVNPLKLTFVNAEKLLITRDLCGGAQPAFVPRPEQTTQRLVHARFKDGFKTFSSYIADAVEPYLSRTSLAGVNYTIEINGEVDENGGITNLKNSDSHGQDIARGLMLQLRSLPTLFPATLDDKPVKEKFTISFKFFNGMYEFTYRFLPIGS